MKVSTLSVFTLLLYSGLLPSTCEGANILVLVPSRSYSHFVVVEPLLVALLGRGHNLTVVNSFPRDPPLANYHDIPVGHLLSQVQNNLPLERMLNIGKTAINNMNAIWAAGNGICKNLLQSEAIHELYWSNMQFDLVLTHIFTYECFSIFAHRFDTPIVSIVTSSALPWASARVGNPEHPAYIVNNFVDAHEKMSLFRRCVNTLAWLWATVAVHPNSYDVADQLIRAHLDPYAPPVRDVIKRTSLVLVNSHLSILQARPLVPNLIEIGGIHMKEPKPLPEDLQSFLDGAADGAIVFSLGSLLRAGSIGQDMLRALMSAFATLPQRVVFKYDEPEGHWPPNVLVRKWLPQRDLLAHPKVRALMAHGGLASTIEAVYSGTPLVGTPVFADQYNNIQSLVLKGSAVLLDIRDQDLTKERILEALHNVLNDPSYKHNAMLISQRFRDRPQAPLDSALYWTEYVLRHRGAPHLRARVADQPWYQFLLLDVIAVFLVVIVISYRLCRTVFCCILQYLRKFTHSSTVIAKTD